MPPRSGQGWVIASVCFQRIWGRAMKTRWTTFSTPRKREWKSGREERRGNAATDQPGSPRQPAHLATVDHQTSAFDSHLRRGYPDRYVKGRDLTPFQRHWHASNEK